MQSISWSWIMLWPIAVLLCCSTTGFGTELPGIAPQVSSVFPHGGKRGTELDVELRGTYLDSAKEIRFDDPGIEARIESANFRQARARVRIKPSVETGRHEFRLLTGRGAWFGVFWVGSTDESLEVEPNDSLRNAQNISVPALINGRADGADPDYYRFHADAGQTVVFDVIATRLGSALDPVLTLFDERGKELAYNDDAYIFKDARIAHTFTRPGVYAVLVSASFERSSKDADYRVLVTSNAYPRSALPLGARKGTMLEVVLRGWNMDRADRVSLGKDVAEGRILERTRESLRVQIDVPPSAPAGTSYLHVMSRGMDAEPVRFEVGQLPELTVGSSQALRVKASVVVNGQLPETGDRLKRVHSIEFDADAGGRYEFQVNAWRQGEVFDPVITLFGPDGRILGQEDDPAPNSFIHHPASHDPRLVFVAPQSGRYRIQVRDATYEGGGGYRLTIRPIAPGFEAEVRSPQLTIYTGRTANLLAVVRRTGGVHQVEPFRKPDNEIEQFRLIEKDGWDTPIKVWVEGLPEGVSAEPVTAEPKNTVFKGNDGEELFVDGTVVEIPVRVNPGTRPGLYEVRVMAKGAYQGRDVHRQAVVLSGTIRSMRLEASAGQKLFLNLIEAPAIFWNTPAEIQITRGGHASLRAGVVRFEGKYRVDVEPKASVAGFQIGKASAGVEGEEIDIPVEAAADAPSPAGRLILVATFERNGRLERVDSPPIELRLKP